MSQTVLITGCSSGIGRATASFDDNPRSRASLILVRMKTW